MRLENSLIVSFLAAATLAPATAAVAPAGPIAHGSPVRALAQRELGDAGSGAAPNQASANGSAPVWPMDPADLLRLVPLPVVARSGAAAHRDSLLAFLIAPIPGRFNQGNQSIAHHRISRESCRAALRDVVIQTEEQLGICKAPNMVPVFGNGDPGSAKSCIDVFEFPNRACELPFVWGSPGEAEMVCGLEGKRLCTQSEWATACSADPAGREKRAYAYGNTLDLATCNTSVPHETGPDGKAWRCNVHDATTTWNSCSTDTEPSGAYPRCRSRLGVFDQHGNVAEEMTRTEDGVVYTQLRGSAFFYVDVAREPGKAALHPERESYPDTCSYEPRWHVEKLKESLHVNYHLGFRCCKSI